MKSLFSCLLAVFLIISLTSSKVLSSENDAIQNKSQMIIANKYAERFCSAKVDYFFEGLDNEKTLKYSYFRYIGMQSEEIFSKDMKKRLIHQIKEKCLLSNEEERELNEFFLKESHFKSK